MVGELTRAHRRRLGLTQEELAERTGLSARAIRAIETGRSSAPRAASIRLLADAFGLSGAERERYYSAAAAADPAVAVAASSDVVRPAPATAGDPPPMRTPRQLPLAAACFAGRSEELDRLDAFLADGASTIVVISGPAGVGKSALAVHWAHRAAEWFPDGQLFVNLGGFGPPGAMISPGMAIRGFLHALEIPSHQIPAELAGQAALYRSVLARRRMLVVIDNARDAEQVRPLIPAARGCLVIVTSRQQLIGLVVTEGAFPVPLDLLTVEESRQVLIARLGQHRVAAEPAAVDELIARCSRLPLALAVVAGRAATRPAAALAGLAGQLRRTRGQLDALYGDDAVSDARTVFFWSYRPLSQPAARLFRLLGLRAGPDCSVPAAASLAGVGLSHVRPLLAELTGAGLVTEDRPGRYVLHDLMRSYAAELAEQVDPDEDRRAALHRLFDHYLRAAATADLLLTPHRDRLPLVTAVPGSVRSGPADHTEALAWFAAEAEVLLTAVRHAVELGFDAHAWQLASALHTFLVRQGYWHEAVAAHRSGLLSAQRLDDRYAQAHSRYQLGRALIDLGGIEEALRELYLAEGGCAELGDFAGQARIHQALGVTFERQGRYRDAMGHVTRALELGRRAGDTFLQARALNAIGWHHAHLGDHEQARTCCEQALILIEEIGDRDGAADTWDSIGFALHHLGQHAEAADCYRRAIQLYRDLGHRFYVAITLVHLGRTYDAAGDPERARVARQEIMAILDELDRPEVNQVLTLLGHLDHPVAAAAVLPA